MALEPSALGEMLEVVCRGGSTNWPALATLQCVAHLCKYQKLIELPKRCLGHLIKIPELTPLLVDLASHCGTHEMLSAYVAGLASNSLGNHNYLRLLEEALVSLPLRPIVAQMLIPHLSRFLQTTEDEEAAQANSELMQLLLRHCGQRYSTQVDEAIQAALQAHPTKAHRKKLVELLDATWDGTRRMEHTVVPCAEGTSTTLYLALEHPTCSVRLSAMNCILEAISGPGGLDFAAMPKTLAEAFAMRLRDEDSAVVSAALSQPKLLLQAQVDAVEQSWIHLAARPGQDTDGKLAAKAVLVLARHVLPLGRSDDAVLAVACSAIQGMMPCRQEKNNVGALRVMRQAAELADYCTLFAPLKALHQQFTEAVPPSSTKKKKSKTPEKAAKAPAVSKSELLHKLAQALGQPAGETASRVALYKAAAESKNHLASLTMMLALALGAQHSASDASAAAAVIQQEMSAATSAASTLSSLCAQAASHTTIELLENAINSSEPEPRLALAVSLTPLVLSKLEGYISSTQVATLTPVVGGFTCDGVPVFPLAMTEGHESAAAMSAVVGAFLALCAVHDLEAVQHQLQAVVKSFDSPASTLRFLTSFWLGPHRSETPLLQVAVLTPSLYSQFVLPLSAPILSLSLCIMLVVMMRSKELKILSFVPLTTL